MFFSTDMVDDDYHELSQYYDMLGQVAVKRRNLAVHNQTHDQRPSSVNFSVVSVDWSRLRLS